MLQLHHHHSTPDLQLPVNILLSSLIGLAVNMTALLPVPINAKVPILALEFYGEILEFGQLMLINSKSLLFFVRFLSGLKCDTYLSETGMKVNMFCHYTVHTTADAKELHIFLWGK